MAFPAFFFWGLTLRQKPMGCDTRVFVRIGTAYYTYNLRDSASLNLRFLISKVEGDDNTCPIKLWALQASGFQHARHTLGICPGCAPFLRRLIATGITSTKELRWLGYRTDLFVRLSLVPKPKKLVDHLQEIEHVGDLGQPAAYELECLWGQQLRRNLHIHGTSCWEHHSSVRRKNWVSTPHTKPQELS